MYLLGTVFTVAWKNEKKFEVFKNRGKNYEN